MAIDEAQQVVLLLLRDMLSDQEVVRVQGALKSDWKRVRDAAEELGVSSLLSRNIHQLAANVPDEARQHFHDLLQENTAHNLRMLLDFRTLALALQAQEVRFLPLKGIHLCGALYQNPGERSLEDIDVLCGLEDLPRARTILEALGYRAARPFDIEFELRTHQHLPAFLRSGSAPVELHTTLLEPRFDRGLTWTELWNRSEPGEVGGAHVRVLSPSDLLIYLCAHAPYHHTYVNSLRMLYDVKLVVLRYASVLDWQQVASRARSAGLLNAVFLTLRLTDELLGCHLPASAWKVLRPAEFHEHLEKAAIERILSRPGASPVVSAVWSKSGAWQRATGIWDRIAVPRQVVAARYHLPPKSWRVYPFYLVRVWELLRDNGRVLLGLLTSRKASVEQARGEGELLSYLGWWN